MPRPMTPASTPEASLRDLAYARRSPPVVLSTFWDASN